MAPRAKAGPARGAADPQALRQEIARTRADLGAKLAQLQHQLLGGPAEPAGKGNTMASTKTSKKGASSAKGAKAKTTAKKSSAKKSSAKGSAKKGKASSSKRSASGSAARSKGKATGGPKTAKVLTRARKVLGKVAASAASGAVAGALEGAASAVEETAHGGSR